MGGLVSMVKQLFNSFESEKRILMLGERIARAFPVHKCSLLGLDAAGKTTVLYKLQLGDVVTTIPTIGFNVESLSYKNLKMTLW